MKDPYKVLGVSQSASQEEIKKAYRKLAKALHPDRHPGDVKNAEKFKELSAAYQILGTAEQRQRFDRGEIDAAGRERVHQEFRHAGGGRASGGFGGFGGFGSSRGGPGDFFSSGTPEDMFSELFGFKRGPRKGFSAKGKDQKFSLKVNFLDAARGTTRRIQLNGGKTLDVRIPAGIEDGQQIRLKGQGGPGGQGAEPGDALVEVKVEPHPLFTRTGRDIHLELPVSLPEAVLGAKIKVPTIHGEVTLTVPRGSSSGSMLRLKGKGVAGDGRKPHGDQYVKIKIVLPPKPDPGLEKIIEEWSRGNTYEVRGKDFGA